MPKGSEWGYFIFVTIGFLILNLTIIFFGSVAEIKRNWPVYRCNPGYFPLYPVLSNDMSGDFAGCIQNTTYDFMPELLAPLNYITDQLSNLGLGFVNDIQGVRDMFNYIRDKITGVFNMIFGIFINLIIEFTKIGISLKDMMGKVVGILSVVFYIIEGSITTMDASAKTLFSPVIAITCFHPNTQIKLKNGQIYCIKDIPLGSILENDARVQVVLNIEKTEPLYLLKKIGVNASDIYVSGSHFILYNNKFIQVKHCPLAISQTKVQSDNYISLITTNHTIQIGNTIFWDWEDDELYK